MPAWKAGKAALWRAGSPGADAAERRYLAARILAARAEDLATVPTEALRGVLAAVEAALQERESRRRRGWRRASEQDR